MILHTQPSKPWNDDDFVLLEAYQILENERCSQCGLPVYICHNESNTVQFRVIEDACKAIEVKDKHEERRSSKKDRNGNAKSNSGVILRPEPFMPDGSDLTSLREPYYRALSEKATALEEPSKG